MQSCTNAPCGPEQRFSEEEILARLFMESSPEKGKYGGELDLDKGAR